MISNIASHARSESHGRLSGGIAVTLCVAAAVALVVAARALSAGSSLGIGFALVVALSPFALYLGLMRPVALPFGLYVFSIPFSELTWLPGLDTLSRALGYLSFIAFLVWMLRTKRIIKPPLATLAWLGLITWMFASLFWALDTGHATTALWEYVKLFGLFAIASFMAVERADVRIAALSAALGGLASAAYAGLLYIRGEQISEDRLIITSGAEHVDPNIFAAALLLPIALVITAALGTVHPLRKIGLFFCVAVLLVGLYASGSRGGIVAVAVMLAYLIWRTRYRLQLLFVSAALTLFSLGFKMSVWERFKNLHTGRLSIWHTGIKAFEQHWLVGVGVGNFQDAFNRALLLANSHFEGWNRAPHNPVVMTAVELGVVGLLLLIVAMVAQLSMLRDMSPLDPLHDLRTALEAAMLGTLAASMFLGLLGDKHTWLIFILAAFARAAALPRLHSPDRRPAVLRPAPAGRNGIVRPWAQPTRRVPNSMVLHHNKGWGRPS